jgi:hypothetical protein
MLPSLAKLAVGGQGDEAEVVVWLLVALQVPGAELLDAAAVGTASVS